MNDSISTLTIRIMSVSDGIIFRFAI